MSSPVKPDSRRHNKDRQTTRPSALRLTLDGYLGHPDTGTTTNFNQLRSLIEQQFNNSEVSRRLTKASSAAREIGQSLMNHPEQRASNLLFNDLCNAVGLFRHFADQPLPDDTRQAQRQLKHAERLAAHMQVCFQILIDRQFTLDGLNFAAHLTLRHCFKAMEDGCHKARAGLASPAPESKPRHSDKTRTRRTGKPQVSPAEPTTAVIARQKEWLRRMQSGIQDHFHFVESRFSPSAQLNDATDAMWRRIRHSAQQADPWNPDKLIGELRRTCPGEHNPCSERVEHALAFHLVELKDRIESSPEDPVAAIAQLKTIWTHAKQAQKYVAALTQQKLVFRPAHPDHMGLQCHLLEDICQQVLVALNTFSNLTWATEHETRKTDQQYQQIHAHLWKTLDQHPVLSAVSGYRFDDRKSSLAMECTLLRQPLWPAYVRTRLNHPNIAQLKVDGLNSHPNIVEYAFAELYEHTRQMMEIFTERVRDNCLGVEHLRLCLQNLDVMEEAMGHLFRQEAQVAGIRFSAQQFPDRELGALRTAIVEAIKAIERIVLG